MVFLTTQGHWGPDTGRKGRGRSHLDPPALGLGQARGFSLPVARLPKSSSPTGCPLEFWPLVTKLTDLEVQ